MSEPHASGNHKANLFHKKAVRIILDFAIATASTILLVFARHAYDSVGKSTTWTSSGGISYTFFGPKNAGIWEVIAPVAAVTLLLSLCDLLRQFSKRT